MIQELSDKPHYRYFIKMERKWRIFCDEHGEWWTLQEPWNTAHECLWCHGWVLLGKLPGIGQRKRGRDTDAGKSVNAGK